MRDDTRRKFLHAAGAALASAPAVLAQRKSNENIRAGFIGVGNRGFFLFREFQQLQGFEINTVCDLYEGNLARAKEFSKNQRIALTKEWEKVAANPRLDAVVIATPDFWHAPMALAAIKAKKHVYLEKPMCMTVEEAKQIRAAVKANNVTLQLGHNRNSSGVLFKAREIYRSGRLGAVPLIRTYMDRAFSRPPWKFYTDANINTMPKDASPATIDWPRFIRAAPEKRPFNAEEFFRWRGWWNYSTGIAGDLMSHLWDSVNGIAGMGIPATCQAQGSAYFWKNDVAVPDMWHTVFDYPHKELTITFSSNFVNRRTGDLVQALGREATLEVTPNTCRVFAAEWRAQEKGQAPNLKAEYTFQPGEIKVSSHWQDFVDCIRSGETPRCGVDRAFEEAVVIAMSIEAYRRKREVRWDFKKEEFI